MIQMLLAEPAARTAIGMIVAVIIIAVILIVIVSVKVEKACGCPGNEHLCGAQHESMCGCGKEGLAPGPRGAPTRGASGPARLAPHYGTYTRGPGAPYGALPLPRPPDSTFFRRNHWRGARWYGPPPSNYYQAHNWYWPGPTDIDAVYWDGTKYAPCLTCKNPEDCRDCPAAKRWFQGW